MRVRLSAACTLLLMACGSNINVRTAAIPNFTLAGRSTFRILPVPRRSDGVPLGQNDPMLANSITNRALRGYIIRALELRGYRPNERGTVLISIIDPATHQLLWRGQGVTSVSDVPNEYVAQLGKIVKAIVNKLPRETAVSTPR